ncbi:MAG: GntR family transcriptional regulator [Deinococcales bacterium]
MIACVSHFIAATVSGTALIEKQLAEQFGVSKTPVREALLRLAQTGLVDFIPNMGKRPST